MCVLKDYLSIETAVGWDVDSFSRTIVPPHVNHLSIETAVGRDVDSFSTTFVPPHVNHLSIVPTST